MGASLLALAKSIYYPHATPAIGNSANNDFVSHHVQIQVDIVD